MVTAAEVEAGLAIASQIVNGLIKLAPAIQKGVVSSAPYVQAIGGLITGGNATQEQIDALLVQLEADSADFQTPLPEDDGTTTT